MSVHRIILVQWFAIAAISALCAWNFFSIDASRARNCAGFMKYNGTLISIVAAGKPSKQFAYYREHPTELKGALEKYNSALRKLRAYHCT